VPVSLVKEENMENRIFVRGGGKNVLLTLKKKIKDEKLNRENKLQSNLYKKCRIVASLVIIWLLLNQTPVVADVTDNLSGSLKQLLGSREVITDESGYYSAPANAKINYLEKRIEELQEKTEVLKQIIDAK
jgi:hypothetical protein